MEIWVGVFLFIIALQALLQAGFVVSLAVGAHRGGQALASFEARVDRDLSRHVESAIRVTERAAAAADSARERTEQATAALVEAGTRVRGVLDRASSLVARTASRPEEAADDDPEGDADERSEEGGFTLPGAVDQGLAFFKGAQRAWQVWRELKG